MHIKFRALMLYVYVWQQVFHITLLFTYILIHVSISKSNCRYTVFFLHFCIYRSQMEKQKQNQQQQKKTNNKKTKKGKISLKWK